MVTNPKPVVVEPLASNRISPGVAARVAPSITDSVLSGGRLAGHSLPAGVPSVQMIWIVVSVKITR